MLASLHLVVVDAGQTTALAPLLTYPIILGGLYGAARGIYDIVAAIRNLGPPPPQRRP